MGELITENGDARPFIGELRVLIGECKEPEGPMEVGLSKGGCIPRWDVGEPRGDEVICPDESVGKNEKKKHYKKT